MRSIICKNYLVKIGSQIWSNSSSWLINNIFRLKHKRIWTTASICIAHTHHMIYKIYHLLRFLCCACIVYKTQFRGICKKRKLIFHLIRKYNPHHNDSKLIHMIDQILSNKLNLLSLNSTCTRYINFFLLINNLKMRHLKIITYFLSDIDSLNDFSKSFFCKISV